MNNIEARPPLKEVAKRSIYIAVALYLIAYAYSSGHYRFIQYTSLIMSLIVVYYKVSKILCESGRKRRERFWGESSLLLAFVHQVVFYSTVIFIPINFHVNEWSALRVLHLIIAFAIKEIADPKRQNKWIH